MRKVIRKQDDDLSRPRSYICMSAVKTPSNLGGSQGRNLRFRGVPHIILIITSSCIASASGGQDVFLDQ